MKILGIDPGYGRIGWGIIDYSKRKAKYIACDCITTSKNSPFNDRLLTVFKAITDVIKKQKVEEIAVESLFFNTNQKTAILASHARGVIVLAGVMSGLPVFDYTPLQVKQALIGYGRADKKQVQDILKFHLQTEEVFKQDDAADAVAVALTHAYTNRRLI